jgi:hypothetical protein
MEEDELLVCDKAFKGECQIHKNRMHRGDPPCILAWTVKYLHLRKKSAEHTVTGWMIGSAICGGILTRYKELI